MKYLIVRLYYRSSLSEVSEIKRPENSQMHDIVQLLLVMSQTQAENLATDLLEQTSLVQTVSNTHFVQDILDHITKAFIFRYPGEADANEASLRLTGLDPMLADPSTRAFANHNMLLVDAADLAAFTTLERFAEVPLAWATATIDTDNNIWLNAHHRPYSDHQFASETGTYWTPCLSQLVWDNVYDVVNSNPFVTSNES